MFSSPTVRGHLFINNTQSLRINKYYVILYNTLKNFDQISGVRDIWTQSHLLAVDYPNLYLRFIFVLFYNVYNIYCYCYYY